MWVSLLPFLVHLYVLFRRCWKSKKDKKLVILDFNGVVCFREYALRPEGRVYAHLDHEAVRLVDSVTWKRPGWEAFRDELFEKYHVAVWSACVKRNLDNLVTFLFREDQRQKLVFAWDQSFCVMDGFHPRKPHVPNFTKPISKIQEQFPEFQDILLLDDSPEKCSCNDQKFYHLVKSWTPDMKDDDELQRLLQMIEK
jgi:hypothetical protein